MPRSSREADLSRRFRSILRCGAKPTLSPITSVVIVAENSSENCGPLNLRFCFRVRMRASCFR